VQDAHADDGDAREERDERRDDALGVGAEIALVEDQHRLGAALLDGREVASQPILVEEVALARVVLPFAEGAHDAHDVDVGRDDLRLRALTRGAPDEARPSLHEVLDDERGRGVGVRARDPVTDLRPLHRRLPGVLAMTAEDGLANSGAGPRDGAHAVRDRDPRRHEPALQLVELRLEERTVTDALENLVLLPRGRGVAKDLSQGRRSVFSMNRRRGSHVPVCDRSLATPRCASCRRPC